MTCPTLALAPVMLVEQWSACLWTRCINVEDGLQSRLLIEKPSVLLQMWAAFSSFLSPETSKHKAPRASHRADHDQGSLWKEDHLSTMEPLWLKLNCDHYAAYGKFTSKPTDSTSILQAFTGPHLCWAGVWGTIPRFSKYLIFIAFEEGRGGEENS